LIRRTWKRYARGGAEGGTGWRRTALAEYLDVAESARGADYTERVNRAGCSARRTRRSARCFEPPLPGRLRRRVSRHRSAQVRRDAGDRGRRARLVAGGDRTSDLRIPGAASTGSDFPGAPFPRYDGNPAEIIVLCTSRPCGPPCCAPPARWPSGLPITRRPADQVAGPRPALRRGGGTGGGRGGAARAPTLRSGGNSPSRGWPRALTSS